MAKVTVDADIHQYTGAAFDVLVVVAGSPAGANVTATLSEPRGRPPLIAPMQNVKVSAGGTLSFTFIVTLNGPGPALLMAEADDDKHTSYDSDAQRIDVV